MKFKTAYNANEFDKPVSVCQSPSMTQQHFKDECDINSIVKKYAVTGQVDSNIIRQGTYADVSEIPDYQAALAIVQDADERFMSLPAEVRKRFDNDPGSVLQFLSDANNRDEAIKLGFIDAPAVDNIVDNENA